MIGILSRSRYQCERYAQWEKWAEVTPGHTQTVREMIHKSAMVGQTIYYWNWSHIYKLILGRIIM